MISVEEDIPPSNLLYSVVKTLLVILLRDIALGVGHSYLPAAVNERKALQLNIDHDFGH
jgi:hypothetical protein